MEKELEIRKAPEELTAEDLANVNGGVNCVSDDCDCSKNCGDCPNHSR